MVTTYSGGMMRRLEIAQALVNQPRILSSMNPASVWTLAKRSIWEHIDGLRNDFGTTIIMTTQI